MAPSIFPSTPTDLPLMRMQLLWQHALTHLKHSPQLSAYYTSRMRLVAQQQRVALPKAMLARFCAACSLIHVPGVNCDVRVRVTTRSRRSRVRIGARAKSKKLAVVRSCWACGTATRQPCDIDVQAETRSAPRDTRTRPVPSRTGAAVVDGRALAARLSADLFGLGSEFIAFSS